MHALDHDAQILLSEFDPSSHAARERMLLPRLAPQEQVRYRSFSAEARRLSWLAGRELLCAAVTQALGEVDAAALLTEEHGGVRYSQGRVHLNLSHSGGWFAAAVAQVPVGIDIERLRPRAVTTQVARIFCDAEARWLERQADPLGAFYTLWTLKESACKAAGLSMWDALRHACFDPETGRGRLSSPFPTGEWRFMHAEFQPGWRLALALHGIGGMARIACWRQMDGSWKDAALAEAAHLAAG